MAAPVGVSTLVAEDALKFVVPTFFGLALFAPFWNRTIGADALLLLSLLFGFAATPIVGKAYLRVIERFSEAPKKIDCLVKRGKDRWDYDAMFHLSSKDDRTAITLADARATLTLLISAYFVAYATFVLLWGLFQIDWHASENIAEVMASLATINVPLMYELWAPALLCIGIAVVIGRVMFGQYVQQQQLIFGSQYPILARHMHVQHGGIARSIWGRVLFENSSAASGAAGETSLGNLEIRLCDNTGAEIASTCSADDGQFVFDVHPGMYISQCLSIKVADPRFNGAEELAIERKSMPEVIIRLSHKGKLSG